MKKVIIVFCALIICTALFIGLNQNNEKHTEYLRIHIRANSNSEEDQSVKYLVKEKIVEYLTPLISQVNTKSQAEDLINSKISDIEKIAEAELLKEGYDYGAKAKICNEKFPTRVYEDFTLESGFYDALIVNLGSGKGDNWWCVVYPPLCFTGSGTNYVYKSKIKEIIDSFYNERG